MKQRWTNRKFRKR